MLDSRVTFNELVQNATHHRARFTALFRISLDYFLKEQETIVSARDVQQVSRPAHSAKALPFEELPAKYARRLPSEAEIDAIMVCRFCHCNVQ